MHFQLLFTSFLYPGPTLFGNFHLNLYTAPAYLACAMNIFGAAMLFQFFQEHYAGLVEAKSGRDDDVSLANNGVSNRKIQEKSGKIEKFAEKESKMCNKCSKVYEKNLDTTKKLIRLDSHQWLLQDSVLEEVMS